VVNHILPQKPILKGIGCLLQKYSADFNEQVIESDMQIPRIASK